MKTETVLRLSKSLRREAAVHQEQAKGASWERHARAQTDLCNAADELESLCGELTQAKARVAELETVVDAVTAAAYSVDPDAEHHIHMHSKQLPDYHRSACAAIQRVREALPGFVESGAIDAGEHPELCV